MRLIQIRGRSMLAMAVRSDTSLKGTSFQTHLGNDQVIQFPLSVSRRNQNTQPLLLGALKRRSLVVGISMTRHRFFRPSRREFSTAFRSQIRIQTREMNRYYIRISLPRAPLRSDPHHENGMQIIFFPSNLIIITIIQIIKSLLLSPLRFSIEFMFL